MLDAVREYRWIRRTGAASNDALPALLVGEICHKVVCAPYFEGKDIVEILALEPDVVSELCAEIAGFDEGGFLDDFIDLGRCQRVGWREGRRMTFAVRINLR